MRNKELQNDFTGDESKLSFWTSEDLESAQILSAFKNAFLDRRKNAFSVPTKSAKEE